MEPSLGGPEHRQGGVLGRGSRALSHRVTEESGLARAKHAEPENLEEGHGLNAGRRENSPDTGKVTGEDAVRAGA